MNAKALAAVLLPVVAVGGLVLWRHAAPTAIASPSLPRAAVIALAAAAAMSSHADPAIAAATDGSQQMDLPTAIDSGNLKAEFKGNGRELLEVAATNRSKAPLTVFIEPGLVFESGRSDVVVVRPTQIELAAGQTVRASLQTAATRSTNKLANTTYALTFNHVPRVELFLAYVQQHLELSPAAIQTAVLALTDNLPLSSVAKFPSATSELKSRFNTDIFRVETVEILSALSALRDVGIPDSSLAMTIDPQLRIEAMIEPLCRAVSMRYYAITPETEWNFWKTELLSGEPSTRHYALYGIARFYPEVALEMLPKWARETKTNPVFRLAALQALADTQRPEAVNLLNHLADELGRSSDLGRAAVGAALALDQRLGVLASTKTAQISFRSTTGLAEF